MRDKRIDRIGEENKNSYGNKYKIVKYNTYSDITIEFENGYKKETSYKEFLNGHIKYPYDKSLCGVGYIGEGKYKQYLKNNIATIQYAHWNNMLKRCYNENSLKKRPNYGECTVCEDWFNFQNFAKWFDENYYQINDEIMYLDKDILVKGNKIYSPQTCIFVNNRINVLFTNRNNFRGTEPIGVHKTKSGKFLSVRQNGDGKKVNLGRFDTAEEAFTTYKKSKEDYIKKVADEYKDKIPQKLYDALYNYEVEITD